MISRVRGPSTHHASNVADEDDGREIRRAERERGKPGAYVASTQNKAINVLGVLARIYANANHNTHENQNDAYLCNHERTPLSSAKHIGQPMRRRAQIGSNQAGRSQSPVIETRTKSDAGTPPGRSASCRIQQSKPARRQNEHTSRPIAKRASPSARQRQTRATDQGK